VTGPGRDGRPSDGTDHVRAYKDVIGELNGAAEALRERERRQADALKRRLDELAEASADVERRATLARLGVELHWDAVLDRLWHEQWMTLRPHPRPAADADPDDLEGLVAAADRAAEAVLEASRRRTFGLGAR
jgi:hypothetical protein